MSWLRTDDGFTSHPKFSGWKAQEKWAFLELMHYCARYRTEGVIPSDLALLPRGVNKRLLALAERSGWIDRDAQTRMVIHDWSLYNPKDATAADRKRAQRERDMNRDIDRDQDRDTNRDETVTRAQARAEPVPSPTTNPSQSVNPLLDQPSEERPTDRHSTNGRTPEEQARIDAVDRWWEDEPAKGVLERDPYSEPFNDLSPLGEQLAAAKAREENT